MKRMLSMSAAAVMMIATLTPPPALALGLELVYDPTNYAQNVLTAARSLEQIHNQISQIEQQARMLARNPLQLSPELSSAIGQARQLFNTAKGVAFEIDRISDDLKRLYPETFKDFDLASIGQSTETWLAEDRASIERAMRAQAQATEVLGAMQGRMDRALSASAVSDGQTGAVQAGNQLLGVNATELMQIHALLIAESRALATERMERVAREQRAREIQRRAFPTDGAVTLAASRSAF